MIYITEDNYEKIHTDFKGKFENFQKIKSMEYLVGKRTMLLNNNGGLGIESVSFEVIQNYKRDLIMNNGEVATYLELDEWNRHLYEINLSSGKKVTVCLLEEYIRENKPMFSLTDYGEPNGPLKEEYQIEIYQ